MAFSGKYELRSSGQHMCGRVPERERRDNDRRNTCRVNDQNISKLDEKHKAQICQVREFWIYKKCQNSSQQDGFKTIEKDKNMKIILIKMDTLTRALSFPTGGNGQRILW